MYGVVAGYDLVTPGDGDMLRLHVQHALSLGLPELVSGPDAASPIKIIANGPSALGADLGGDTLAVNGALGVFTRKGLAPTFWAACDPQELVADFLAEAPADTTYLVASKCHPAVFEALQGRNVLLWHLAERPYIDLLVGREAIFPFCTITLCALELANMLGRRSIDVYGWDGCYIGNQHHAIDQADGKDIVTLSVGPRLFATTNSWLFEGHSAVGYFDATSPDVRVHGPGMFAELLRYHDLMKDAA